MFLNPTPGNFRAQARIRLHYHFLFGMSVLLGLQVGARIWN